MGVCWRGAARDTGLRCRPLLCVAEDMATYFPAAFAIPPCSDRCRLGMASPVVRDAGASLPLPHCAQPPSASSRRCVQAANRSRRVIRAEAPDASIPRHVHRSCTVRQGWTGTAPVVGREVPRRHRGRTERRVPQPGFSSRHPDRQVTERSRRDRAGSPLPEGRHRRRPTSTGATIARRRPTPPCPRDPGQAGRAPIAINRIFEIDDHRGPNKFYSWPPHMTEKTWVDEHLFDQPF